MTNLHVKKGDTVMVIAGKNKGKSGVITQAIPGAAKVIIDGLNLVSHYIKPKNAQEKGGIVKRSAAIEVSNVMIICPNCGKTTRVSYKFVTVDGVEKKIRVCKKCTESLENKVKSEAKAAVKATKKTVAKKATAATAEVSAEVVTEAPKKKATKKAAPKAE